MDAFSSKAKKTFFVRKFPRRGSRHVCVYRKNKKKKGAEPLRVAMETLGGSPGGKKKRERECREWRDAERIGGRRGICIYERMKNGSVFVHFLVCVHGLRPDMMKFLLFCLKNWFFFTKNDFLQFFHIYSQEY